MVKKTHLSLSHQSVAATRAPLKDVSRKLSNNKYNLRTNNTNSSTNRKQASTQIPNYLKGTRSTSNKKTFKKDDDNKDLKHDVMMMISELNIAKEDTKDRTLSISQKMKEFSERLLQTDNTNINYTNNNEMDQNQMSSLVSENSSLLETVKSYERISKEKDEEIVQMKYENEQLKNKSISKRNEIQSEINLLRQEIEERNIVDIKARKAVNAIHEKTALTLKDLDQSDLENLRLAEELRRTVEELQREKRSNSPYGNHIQENLNNTQEMLRSKELQIEQLNDNKSNIIHELQQKLHSEKNANADISELSENKSNTIHELQQKLQSEKNANADISELNENKSNTIHKLQQKLQSEKNANADICEQLSITQQTLSSIEDITASIIASNEHELEMSQSELREKSATASKFQWREKEIKKILARTKLENEDKLNNLQLELTKVKDEANENKENVKHFEAQFTASKCEQTKKIKCLESEISKLEIDVSRTKFKHEENIKHVKLELSQSEKASIDLREQVMSQQSKLSQQSNVIGQLNRKIEDITRTKSKHEGNINSLELKLSQLEAGSTSLHEEVMSQQNKIYQQSAVIGQLTTEIEELTRTKYENEDKLKKYKSELLKSDAVTTVLREEVMSKQNKISQQSAIIDQLTTEVEELTRTKYENEDKMRKYNSELFKSDAVTTVLREEVVSKQNKISQQTAIIDQLNMEVDEITRTKLEHEERLINLKFEISNIEAVATSLRDDLMSSQDRNHQLEGMVQEQQATVDNLNTYIEQMKVSVQNEWNDFSRRLHEDAEVKIREVANSKDTVIHSLNEQLQSYNNYVVQLQNEMTMLRSGGNTNMAPGLQNNMLANNNNNEREQIESDALTKYITARHDQMMS